MPASGANRWRAKTRNADMPPVLSAMIPARGSSARSSQSERYWFWRECFRRNRRLPCGTYFRNPRFPPRPFSAEGCTLLVKLHSSRPMTPPRSHRYPECAIPAGFRQSAGAATTPTRRGASGVSTWSAVNISRHTAILAGRRFMLSVASSRRARQLPARYLDSQPHMSRHTPFVDEDTLIWVKVDICRLESSQREKCRTRGVTSALSSL